jgi:glucokinase
MGAKEKYWIGFDLGGTKMMSCVFDDNLQVIGREKRKTKAQAGAEAGLKRIIETIDRSLADAGISRKQITGIGMSSPGPLDLNKGVILDLPNLGWVDVPLKKTLRKTFDVEVVVANDVDVGTYGEYFMGAGKDARCVFGIFPGTGLGGGCVYEGQILRGKTASCMEIGHVQVQPEGPLCGCGNRGCLETLSSRLAISAAAAAAAYRGEAPHLLATAGMDLKNIKSSVLAASIKAGDVAVEKIVRNASRWLGVGVSMAVNLLAPDVVILGGGLVEAMPDLIVDEVAAAASKHVMPSFRKTFKVVPAKLGDDAGVIGAAAMIKQEFEAKDETPRYPKKS